MDALTEICQRRGVVLIEDAAEAIGSVYLGRKAGSIGLFSTFSFHGTKTITTGEGGMFLTSNPNLFEKVLTLGNHGRARNQSKQFWADIAGFKFKMSNVQAAIGCAQLQRIDDLVFRKRYIMSKYIERFKDIPDISYNPEYPDMKNGFWMPNIVFSTKSKVTRQTLQNDLLRNEVDARVFFWPLSSLPMFSKNLNNKNAYSISGRSINLPSFHDMTDDMINYVSDIALGTLQRKNGKL